MLYILQNTCMRGRRASFFNTPDDGRLTPETCRVTAEKKNPAQCWFKLVFYLTCTTMHGNTNVTFSDAKQARDIYNYKNIKRKLYRTNAAIWYNKICRHLCQGPPCQFFNTPDDGRLTPETCRVEVPNMVMWWPTCNYNTCTRGRRAIFCNTPADGRLTPETCRVTLQKWNLHSVASSWCFIWLILRCTETQK